MRFTRNARALGLGVAGFCTYLQRKGIPLESVDAIYFNQELFEHLELESTRASEWMAQKWGAPEWAARVDETIPVRNCSRLAVAPTKSTALIMGGISEGINPDPAHVFTQSTAGGEMNRITPVLLDKMKEKGVYDKKHIQEIVDAFGSVQGVDWLDEEEKQVFKTAFEIDQHALIRLAAQRGQWTDQWQSLNLFFSAEEDPSYIVDVHREAFNNDAILGLYYIYSQSGIAGSKDREGCAVCQ